MIGAGWLNSLFSNIELRTSLSLGRKIAHASSESEEFLLHLQNEIPQGENPRKWKKFLEERISRGLGEIEIIEKSSEKTTVLVNRYSSAAIDTGIIASSWEVATGKRHKFRWSESRDVLMVELTEEKVNIPPPKEIEKNWLGDDEDTAPSSIIQWNQIRELGSGIWEMDGERKLMVHRDLILRFEEYSLPQIGQLRDSREGDYIWTGVEGNRSLWWTAVADSCRQLFSDSEKHVMISEAKDWTNSSIRNLSLQGLGSLTKPELNNKNGELNAILEGCFHPAISGGVLLGCWERSTGVKGRIKVGSDDGFLSINIVPKRTSIANS